MSDGKKEIKELKKNEMQEVIDFYYFIEDYGHIFYDDQKVLDEPFKQILDGIEKIRQIVSNNYEI